MQDFEKLSQIVNQTNLKENFAHFFFRIAVALGSGHFNEPLHAAASSRESGVSKSIRDCANSKLLSLQ
jgi:hypothetical protein